MWEDTNLVLSRTQENLHSLLIDWESWFRSIRRSSIWQELNEGTTVKKLKPQAQLLKGLVHFTLSRSPFLFSGKKCKPWSKICLEEEELPV